MYNNKKTFLIFGHILKILLFIKFSFISHPPFFLFKLQIYYFWRTICKHIITFLRKYMHNLLWIHSLPYFSLTLLDRPFLIRIVIKIYAQQTYSSFNFEQIFVFFFLKKHPQLNFFKLRCYFKLFFNLWRQNTILKQKNDKRTFNWRTLNIYVNRL